MPVLSILIVDDELRSREALRTALADIADMTVCGEATTGELGLKWTGRMHPDLVIAAAVLPDMTVGDFTRNVLSLHPHTGVLILSRDDPRHADLTIAALEAGAFDFIMKPDYRVREDEVAALRRLLLTRIRGFSIKRYSHLARGFSLDKAPPPEPVGNSASLERAKAEKIVRSSPPESRPESRIEAVLIGASTGGPEALTELIPALPSTLPVPVVVVLHMPRSFTGRMAQSLNRAAAMTVKEAEDETLLLPGHVYLAPGGLHLSLHRDARGRLLLRTLDTPPENGCKPSVDVLFRSAAPVLKGRALAVVLTGMGEDGTKGLLELKKHAVPVLVQDEASSVVWGMPGSAVRAKCADEVLPLSKMAQRITAIVMEQAP